MPAVGGFVFDSSGVPTDREIRIYRRDTGELLGKTRSTGGDDGDPHFDKVSLLLHMTGADNSSVFVDSSKNSYTQAPSSSAKIIQSQADPFGISNGVGYFSGVGHQMAAPAAALPSGSEDATLELYVRPENTGTTRVLLNRDTTGFNFEIQAGGLLGLYFYGPDTYISGGSVPNLAWSHVAFSRQGNTFRLFVNGQIVATATQAISFNGALFFIGSTHQGILPYKGCMSGLRITKGMARYTENFTPPSARFPDVPSLGRPLAFGEYYFATPHTGEVNVVCLDDASAPLENDLILRTFPV